MGPSSMIDFRPSIVCKRIDLARVPNCTYWDVTMWNIRRNARAIQGPLSSRYIGKDLDGRVSGVVVEIRICKHFDNLTIASVLVKLTQV
jgi:hypothetical protein